MNDTDSGQFAAAPDARESDSSKHAQMVDHARRQFEAARDLEIEAKLPRNGATRPEPEFLRHVQESMPGYRIDRELHRGGQGVVYRALQHSTGRTVAIKVMREASFANECARFEREVQILAQLDHPNIVGVIDSGAAAGHDYFVMEFIDGEPLDEFVRRLWREPDVTVEYPMTLRNVIELLAAVCDAVHAAHLHGVIHRDLKPSNVRVDRAGRPHVLDFGLAKFASTSAAPAELRAMTVTGQFLGSLPWASPEQAIGDAAILDLRCDVYSIGVILFQVLTGTFPYRVLGVMSDVLENIAHADPARPSGINRELDGELDTIILKCLQKDPSRRYQTAGEVARDLRHYLANEPIEARRDSMSYLVRKHLRRYRVALALAALFLLAVTGGLAASLAGWREASLRRAESEVSATLATAEAAKAAAVNEFLGEMLTSADPEITRGREVTVLELIDRAAMRLEAGSLRDQPEVEAAARAAVGRTYMSLDRFEQARRHLEAAHAVFRTVHKGPHADTAGVVAALASLANREGDWAAAIVGMNEALDMYQSLWPGDSEEAAQCLGNLAVYHSGPAQRRDEAVEFRQASAEMFGRLLGDDHAATLDARYELAMMLHDSAEAERILHVQISNLQSEEIVDGPHVAYLLSRLAGAMAMQGRTDDAIDLYGRAYDLYASVYGEQSQAVIRCLADLSFCLWLAGRREEQLEMSLRTVNAVRGFYGNDSPETAQYLTEYTSALDNAGRRDEAILGQREALSILRRINRVRETGATSTLLALGRNLYLRNELDELESLMTELLGFSEAELPTDHWARSEALVLVGGAHLKRSEFDEAEKSLLAGYEGLKGNRLVRGYERDAVALLTELYETWDVASPGSGHAEQARVWQAKLDQQSSTRQSH